MNGYLHPVGVHCGAETLGYQHALALIRRSYGSLGYAEKSRL